MSAMFNSLNKQRVSVVAQHSTVPFEKNFFTLIDIKVSSHGIALMSEHPVFRPSPLCNSGVPATIYMSSFCGSRMALILHAIRVLTA